MTGPVMVTLSSGAEVPQAVYQTIRRSIRGLASGDWSRLRALARACQGGSSDGRGRYLNASCVLRPEILHDLVQDCLAHRRPSGAALVDDDIRQLVAASVRGDTGDGGTFWLVDPVTGEDM